MFVSSELVGSGGHSSVKISGVITSKRLSFLMSSFGNMAASRRESANNTTTNRQPGETVQS